MKERRIKEGWKKSRGICMKADSVITLDPHFKVTEKMDVKEKCRKMVMPSVPTPKTKLKLSFLDHIQPPIYIGIIFYYKDSKGPDMHERLVKLEKSLSEALVLFYPFAGRYLEEGGCSFIDCGDQGVEYIVAQVDGHLDKEIDRDMLANLLSYPTESKNGISLTVIQVNVLRCGGLAIGVWFNHRLADTCSLSMFMSAWSTTCRDGMTQVIPPSFILGSLIPQKEIGESVVRTTKPRPSPTENIGKKVVMKIFTFHNDVISKLKAEITEKSNELQASRVEVISAVISKAIIEIRSAKRGVNSKPFLIYHTMNLRGKTNLHITENLCGNFFTRVVTSPINVEQTGITTFSILGIICDAIRKAKLEFSMAADVDMCSLVVEKHKESAAASRKNKDGEINLIRFTSWCKFPFYEVDFGWGKPDFVSYTAPPIEFIVLIDSKSNDGMEAWVTLDIDDMVLLKQKLDNALRF